MKIPAILFLIALIIRLFAILFWQFDGLYGQDPFAYLQQGFAIASSLPQGKLPPIDFFWPNGFPLLIALFTLVTGKTALAGQLAVLLCGVLLSPLVYLLSKDLFLGDPLPVYGEIEGDKPSQVKWAGFLAGLIIAVAGQPILSSIVVMTDMPALFWATLSVWLVVRACAPLHLSKKTLKVTQRNTLAKTFRVWPTGNSALYFLVAGASLTLAIITRWVYILVTPALVAYTLFNLRHHYKKFWWTPILATFSGAIILLPQLWLSFSKPGSLAHSWLTGWQLLNFFLRDFENIDGHFSYLLPMGLYYAQPAGHPAYIFPLLGLGAIWGVWQLGQARWWGPISLLLGWILPVYLFLGGIPYQNFRFGLTLYVPLVVLTGFGLSKLLFLSTAKTLKVAQRNALAKTFRIWPTGVLKIVIILSLLGMLGWAYPMLNNFLTLQNHSKTVARQVEQKLPPQSTLLTFGLTLTLQHYTQLNTLEFFYFDEKSLNTLITKSQVPIYLLLNTQNIEGQWSGKVPQNNYHWLKTNTVLTEIAVFSPYTLFKVEQ